MNYREKIREYISCPQLGDNHYGKWGALRVEQRLLIKRLLDELDRADNYIKKVYLENQKLKEKVNQYENPEDMTLFYMWLDTKAKDKLKQYKSVIDEVNEEIFKYLVSEDYCSAEYKDLPNFLLKINRIIGSVVVKGSDKNE